MQLLQQKHIRLKFFVLSILSQVVAKAHGRDNDIDLLRELAKVTTAIETIVDDTPVMEQIAKDFLETTRNAFFIGRTMDYNVSLEGSLKLKEISYIQVKDSPVENLNTVQLH